MKLILKVSLALLAAVLAIDVGALATDSQQPIEIQADFAELFSNTGRSSIVEPVLAGFRLKGGAKVAELCFEGNSGIIVLPIENFRFCAGK